MMLQCPICKNHFGTESGLRSHMVFKKNNIEELIAERNSLLSEVEHLKGVAVYWRGLAKKEQTIANQYADFIKSLDNPPPVKIKTFMARRPLW